MLKSLWLVTAVVIDGSVRMFFDNAQECREDISLVFRRICPEGMAFDMLLRRDDEANEVVSSVIGYAFDIKEKLYGMDRNHWRLVNIDLCGTQRQGLQF